MQTVEVEPVPIEQLARALSAERAQAMAVSAARARANFGDRVIWHVNATAHGGGVAEMLQTLLAYGLGAKIDNRWLVLDGDAEFFTITKRVHNLLHGDPGDGGPLGEAERNHYEEVLAANLHEMRERTTPHDIVVLHDPQTAGLTNGLRETGASVAWRCHVGRDTSNTETETAWAFLRPYLERADAYVFSRRAYAPVWVDEARLVVVPPSIDPFSAKNRELAPQTVSAILATAGLVSGVEPDGPIAFDRRDGSSGTVRVRTGLVDGPPPPHDAPLVVQVSRWDRLKDMAGVMEGFARMDGPTDAHLMLAGPDVSGVDDDPEGAEVLAECRAQWRALPDGCSRAGAPGVDPDGRRGRERHHHQRAPAARVRSRAEEPRRGVRADGHRGHVEGPGRGGQRGGWDPGPDHRWARRPAHRRSARSRCLRVHAAPAAHRPGPRRSPRLVGPRTRPAAVPRRPPPGPVRRPLLPARRDVSPTRRPQPRSGAARSAERLLGRRRSDATRLPARALRGRAAPRGAVLLRPGHAAGQHRELHRRGPGADRRRRPPAHQRRACPRRVLHPPRHHGRHPGRQLQPRHAAAQRVRRCHHHGGRRPHAARAGVHPA